jgi:hypothetical protein
MRAAAWQAMARGVADRRHPARHPTLATLGDDGPAARTVVLRGWSDGVAEMHTDTASGKVADLRADPRAALHVWLPKARLQIRLSGTSALAVGDEAAWARVPEGARRVYGGSPPPGAALDAWQDHDPAPCQSRFCVLRLRVLRADLLHLGEARHQRAIFRKDDEDWAGVWVAP